MELFKIVYTGWSSITLQRAANHIHYDTDSPRILQSGSFNSNSIYIHYWNNIFAQNIRLLINMKIY